ncbi:MULTISPECIES: hypothetical protein [Saliphagus]|uniref:Uncharacterized protein n=1 Tax=Saliphagus infecundisoli TaxID=1849069 RepID=A0ABD5QK86_9EURY|nr:MULTISPECIES: hypothetical protein [Saliphagus]
MSIWIDAARLSTAVNVLILLALSYIWARNYLRIRSKHVMGLLIFALLLLAENALAFYYYLIHEDLSAWFATGVPVIAWRAMLILHVLETAALAFLLWVTWE